ncbi:AraC family transcriptional regulator [Niastella caeni]|uniref:AraC family transcriptional regulator n=1 Tax=Niastella caeni TaxID=2569763 RepID=A0A4S8HG87_9BACT|nr:helix-turn-helix domain-containing protein [Niastella caeni]THU32534.1 AraC family transcriptional regulator [Niastella caeni]
MVTLETYIPASLSQIVKSFWCIKVAGLTDESYTENILPDGHHEIIFHLAVDNAKRGNSTTGWIKEPDSFFAGQTLTSYSLELKNNSVLYGIRFYPHTLSFLFDFPADIITNNILPLQEISAAKELRHCISEDAQDTFTNFEKALLQQYKRTDLSANKFQYINYSVGQILKNKGDIIIDPLIKSTGVSPRYFDTIFKQAVGINPKPFCNIIKLNHFISYRKNHPHRNLTECCYEANFFDQSHLIKLFQKVANQSPRKYFNDSNHINNYFSEL